VQLPCKMYLKVVRLLTYIVLIKLVLAVSESNKKVFFDQAKPKIGKSKIFHREDLTENITNLPWNVQKRVQALKKLQLDYFRVEIEFYKEVYEIERKYNQLLQPLLDRRALLVEGKTEPNQEELNFKLPNGNFDEEKMIDLDIKGIPDFWLTVLKTQDELAHIIRRHDEPILKQLVDIKILEHENTMDYTVEFHFRPNEYFFNTVLSKKYFKNVEIDEEDPLNFDGYILYNVTGSDIDWFPGKDVTKSHRRSFFNFFNPPVFHKIEELSEREREATTTDLDLGIFFRDYVVPRAVLFYMGHRDYVAPYEEPQGEVEALTMETELKLLGMEEFTTEVDIDVNTEQPQ